MDSAKKKAGQVRWRAKNRLHIARYNAAYYSEHTEQIAAWHARPENRKKAGQRSIAWQRAHPVNRAYKRKRLAEFRKRNPGYNTSYANDHKAAKRTNVPFWAIPFFMQEAYRLARLRTKVTGFKWEVDHIVPLRSPMVCGLHCESNLRVIPKSQNCSKGNHIWPDMPTNAASRPLALL